MCGIAMVMNMSKSASVALEMQIQRIMQKDM